MAILQLQDGTVRTSLEDIAQELKPLNIKLECWSVGDDPQLHSLLAQDSLNEDEKEKILKALDGYFEQMKQNAGYKSQDLMVLHPQVPNLDQLIAKFDKTHTHADDEVRYIIDGEGIFGFVRPDGSQVELTVQKQECINVPAGVEHWFRLTKTQRIKAVRYFSNTEGWIPRYRN
jgi:1,2-dihydroxy-3-keto-5-methylthiopentene dioxygenase